MRLQGHTWMSLRGHTWMRLRGHTWMYLKVKCFSNIVKSIAWITGPEIFQYE